MTLPNLERLKIFHIVYENRSILKAADALHVTRSAVSQSLKVLEEELGFSLFIRDSKNFQPTNEANELFKATTPFINTLRKTLHSFEDGATKTIGHLRIGAPLDFGSDHLTKIIGKFRKKFPEISFELTFAVPLKQLDLLCDGKLDLAFIDNGDIHTKNYPVTIQTVMKEEFVLVASHNLLKKHNAIDAKDFQSLSSLPIVDYLPHAPLARMWFKHHFSKNLQVLDIAFSAESVKAVLNAIAADIGIGIVPSQLLINEFKKLKIIEAPKKELVNSIMIVRQQGRNSTFCETEFIKFYKNEPKLK